MNAKSIKNTCKVLIISFVLVLTASCKQDNYKESLTVAGAEITEDFNAVESPNKPEGFDKKELNSPNNLKIIKSANARYKVQNVKQTTAAIKSIAYSYNSYISDLRFENNLYKKENRFTLKIPAIHFDNVMDSISDLVEFVDYENISTKDVTEDFIDIDTRLKTKLEIKERYETILRSKAKTVEDILAVEEKLRIIQEEIESAQGRLKYISNKVAYSTVQIDLYETVDYKEEPEVYKKTFGDKIKEGFASGWSFLETMIIAVFYIWPLLILIILAYLIFKKKLFRK